MKRFYNFFLFLSLILFLQVRTFGQMAPKVLALDDCIRIAIAQNPDLLAAAAQVDIVRARVMESFAPLEPDLSAFYNWTRQLSSLGPPVHAGFITFRAQPLLLSYYKDGLTLNQLIFDGGRTISFFHQEQALKNAQWAAYEKLIQTVTFNTTQAYYQLVANRKLVQVAEEDLKNSEEHLKLAEASYKAGLAAKADVIFAQVPVATARLNLTKVNEAEAQSQASLDRLLSFDVNTTVQVADELAPSPFSVTLEQASQQAIHDRQEIKQAQALVEGARAQLDAANGAYWPEIGAFANYGYTDYGSNVIPGNLGYSYGLQATFGIFDGGFRAGEVKEAQALVRQQTASLESTKQNALLDVKNAYVALESAKESVNEARTELDQASENLAMVEGQYKVGVAPILNLLDAEVSKIQAEQHFISAQADYQIAVSGLKLAMGAL